MSFTPIYFSILKSVNLRYIAAFLKEDEKYMEWRFAEMKNVPILFVAYYTVSVDESILKRCLTTLDPNDNFLELNSAMH